MEDLQMGVGEMNIQVTITKLGPLYFHATISCEGAHPVVAWGFTRAHAAHRVMSTWGREVAARATARVVERPKMQSAA